MFISWAGLRPAPMVAAFLLTTGAVSGQQHPTTQSGVAGHRMVPTTVMTFHSLPGGGVTLSYRYRRMTMGAGHQHVGSDHVSTSSVLRDYPVSPLEMTTARHMMSAMVGLGRGLTGVVMLPLTFRSMDHATASDTAFTTSSSGLGDARVGVVWSGDLREGTALAGGVALSLPTGTLTATDVTPASAPGEAQLPYPMQLGSGSLEVRPELAFTTRRSSIGLGLRLEGVFRLGRNDRGYRLGQSSTLSAWGDFPLIANLRLAVTGAFERWGAIDGADPLIVPQLDVVPAADPRLRSGQELRVAPEIRLRVPSTRLGGQAFAVRLGVPVWHSLKGPQLALAWSLDAFWSLALG